MQFALILILLMGCSSSEKNKADESQITKDIDGYEMNTNESQVVNNIVASYPQEVVKTKTTMNFMGDGRIFFSRVTSIENYKNEKKHGTWIYYGDDGRQIKIEEYVNGKLIE